MNREQQIIKLVSERLRATSDLIVGNGDDAAVLAPSPYPTVISTDTFAENIHFDIMRSAPDSIGYKIIVAALSDVYAMGARPQHLLLTASVPTHVNIDWLIRFFDGVKEACNQFQVQIIGGDTTGSASHLQFTATALGTLTAKKPLRQNSALRGQKVAISRPLGQSLAGLLLLTSYPLWQRESWSRPLIQSFNRPSLSPEHAFWLSEQAETGAVTDISDGLEQDLQKIARQSNCGFDIELSQLPLGTELTTFCSHAQIEPTTLMAQSGEEFSLLYTFTDTSDFCANYRKKFACDPMVIGEVTAGPIQFFKDAKKTELSAAFRFEH